MFIQQPFDEFLGFQYERTSPKSVKVTLPIKALFINSLGMVHGGIISSLADVAMGNTLQSDGSGQQKVVTVDLKVTFLKGATGKSLVADAEVIKIGRTLTHADCLIYDDAGTLVAKATGIFANC
ncbi:PaaI family thioesterase [Bacillaceae bacterium IKA-2]|nr:PaaI family thioesterase [Bacillaceae bacterium IKA-2]